MSVLIPDYSMVDFLLPLIGANNGTVLADFGPKRRAVSVAGNAKTVTDVSKFYGSSVYLDGNGDRVQVGMEAIGTRDFCLSFWFRPTNNGGTQAWARVAQFGANGTNGGLYLVRQGTTVPFRFKCQNYSGGYADVFTDTTMSVANLTWAHVALARQADVWSIFLDGVLASQGTRSTGGNLTGTTAYFGTNTSGSESLQGHLQDIMLIIGSPVYVENFTPPPRRVGEISGTITDHLGQPAARKIYAVPRSLPNLTFRTESAEDGTYSLQLPVTECSRIVLASDTGPIFNDLIDRVIPE